MGFTISGLKPLTARLNAAASGTPKAMAAALYLTAEQVMSLSRPLVPVDTGVLRGSGFVNFPTVTPVGASVEFGYGGAASAYAIVQHERLDYHHTVGQAKYLQEPLEKAAGPLLRGNLKVTL